MSYEMDPRMKRRAEQYLGTGTGQNGPEYGQSAVKRALDILVSSASSPVTLSVLCPLGLAIWIDDGHWPFVDVGNANASGEHIPIWKLRTMIPDAKKHEMEVIGGLSQSAFKRNGGKDPRITTIGRALRKRSLDEAPQMLNVFLGHLSAVGPRMPVQADWNHIEEHKDIEPYQGFVEMLKEGLKFGVTGMYTIMGRDELLDDDRYALEVLYWQRQSLAGDLKIIAATVPALRRAKGK